jgi:hypothetical protein
VNTGTITVSSPLGANFEYSVDGTTFQAATEFAGLESGDYIVTVRRVSDNTCTATTSVTIEPATQVPTPVASVTVAPTCAVKKGTISVDPLGSAFEYSIDGTNFQATTVFAELEPGDYIVTVRRVSDSTCTATSGQITITTSTAHLIISCPEPITLECDDSIDPLNTGSPIVNSECSTVTFTYVDSNLIGGCSEKTGSFTRTFTVVDEFGNTEICEQIISIEDTTAPQFVDQKLEELFTSCDAIPEAIIPTVVDDCDPNVSILFTETKVEGECDLKYTIERIWKATDACGNENSFTQIIHVVCPISVYNGLSVDNNGINDQLYLEGIECYPENNVKIFNRWGVLVFEKDNYNNSNNVFRGISEGRLTVAQNEKLPTGVYYYVISYKFATKDIPQTLNQSGYLYIKSN